MLWVRYQSSPHLYAPCEAVIIQDDREVLRRRFNEETAALGRYGDDVLWEPAEAVDLQAGEVEIYLLTATERAHPPVDCFLLTNDADFLPSGPEVLPDGDVIDARRAALGAQGADSVLLWHRGRFEGYNTTSWPTERSQLAPRFSFRLPRRGHGHELLLVTSLSSAPVSLAADVRLHDAEGRPFEGEASVRVVAHLQGRYFGWTPEALFHRRDLQIAPYHTAGLWLAIATGQAPPGTYSGALALSEGGRNVGEVPLTLEVVDAQVPPDMELHTLLWGSPEHVDYFKRFENVYPADRLEELRDLYWGNALANGWNTFRGGVPWDADEARRRGVKAVVVRHGSNLQERLQALYDRGFRVEEVWVEAFDEPNVHSGDRWLEIARDVKQTAPDAWMWTNPGWQIHQTAEEFRRWAPYVDVWWPFIGNLEQPDLLEVMKQSGKPIGFYVERGWTNLNPMRAWSYYRRMPMETARYDLIGCGFWSATTYYADAWDDLNTRVNYPKAAVIYPGSQGPINTINLAAWREGLNEVLMLRALVRQTGDDARAWAERFFDAPSAADQDTVRDELLAAFEALR